MKTAVVTGAGSGIGAATVGILAQAGWRVACFDRDGGAAEKVAEAAGQGHFGQAVDVSDEAQVKAGFAEVARRFGQLDGLATCAGILETMPFMETTPEAFQRLYAVNVIGSFLPVREAALQMKTGGRICLVGSISGIRGGGFLGTVAYSASKGAVYALAKVAARQLAERGISVNVVSPGGARTAMTVAAHSPEGPPRKLEASPLLNRIGEAEEIGEAIAWLLSPQASYVNGSNLVVDGGLMLL